MKKIIAIAGVLSLSLGMAACGTTAQEEKTTEATDMSTTAQIVGGWKISDSTKDATLPGEVQEAFDKAKGSYTDGELHPVAYIGSQVVAGTNYMVLCKDDSSAYKMAMIYKDLQGDAKITGTSDFSIEDCCDKEDSEKKSVEITGGWTVTQKAGDPEIPDEAKAAFDKAKKNGTGGDLEPIAYLGSQLVSGNNYAFLCLSTDAADCIPSNCIQFVVVYEDLQGNAEVTKTCTIDLAEFNK